MARSTRSTDRQRKTKQKTTGAAESRIDEVDSANIDSHPKLAGRCFYVLPIDLLSWIMRDVGESRFDVDSVNLEIVVASQCVDDVARVGRWRGSWMTHPLLQLSNRQPTNLSRACSPKDRARFARPFTINPLYSIQKHRRIFQSYLGWLMTNPKFLDEHDELLEQNAEAVHRWGVEIDRASTPTLLFGDPRDNPESDPSWREFKRAKDDFFLRWRLSNLPGPYLPIPIGTHPDGMIPVSYFLWSEELTGLYLLPDIVPLPGRDDLRRSIEESRRRSAQPEHLKQWRELIRPANKAKNQFDRFARIFELQHYWRVLHHRHGSALANAVGKLESAFAVWFGVSVETIHQDRLNISRRLGRDWLKRPWPV